uniref:Scarecrow-like protein 9 n=1 Tax=Kalanchoe fedtschenkoi TaxID=63787 RepID=A0A7N0RJF8_KALFE
MDPRLRGGSMASTYGYNHQSASSGLDRCLIGGDRYDGVLWNEHRQFRDFHHFENDQTPSTSSVASVPEEESPEEDFSDVVLKYINQMLMEEDMEDKTCMLQDSLDLQAAEKPFYEALGEKYPPSPSLQQLPETFCYRGCQSPDAVSALNYNIADATYSGGGYMVDAGSINGYHGNYDYIQEEVIPVYTTTSQSSLTCSNGVFAMLNGMVDSPISTLQISDFCKESASVWQFKKGVEEANKFLPASANLLVNLEGRASTYLESESETNGALVKEETKNDGEYVSYGSRGRKHLHREADESEERSSKQAAVYVESNVKSEIFDEVLLCSKGSTTSPLATLRESLQNGTSKASQQNGLVKAAVSTGKGRGRKQNGKKEVVDLRTLLVHCAQAVAADDSRSANELLKQIRQHASPFGDGNQRLAHCFADGLEARLAGTGSQIYKGLTSKKTSAADILKAYHLYLAACPFRKISNFFSNKTILNVAANSMRVHIIDFGILYGFQWPTFLQRISLRAGGPPKVRITGVDFPQPGFRPAERVEETGRRIAGYAERFGIPFEFNAIAKKWETIKIEDLKIDQDELLIVNSLYRFQNLHDETVAANSARSIVLNLVRKITPEVFILGIVNGAYNAPFFVTRFREALFHFSALFDMLETNVPREYLERMLIEREIFGREALNVIACEGWERIERPETYKQWQVRQLRAGFRQLPVDRDIIKRAEDRVKSSYHKDFVVDEDGQWFLQGWKGRTIYALSSWKPV